MTIVSDAFHCNLVSSLICAEIALLASMATALQTTCALRIEMPFVTDHAAIRSTQVVMHHLSQPERQVRHAVHRCDHFQDGQLRDRRQRVRCQ